MTTKDNVPLACQLTAAEMAYRRQLIIENLVPYIEERQETEAGYAFKFSPQDEVACELLAFILLERQCCPFFQFELVFTPDNSAIWLYLQGADGAKQFIEDKLAVLV